MRIGQENDNRKYRRLRKSDPYAAKAAVEAPQAKMQYCPNCGREISIHRKNWGGYCFQCKNE